jgi:hypothetical protein
MGEQGGGTSYTKHRGEEGDWKSQIQRAEPQAHINGAEMAKFCLQAAHIAHIGLTKSRNCWQDGGVKKNGTEVKAEGRKREKQKKGIFVWMQ